MRLLICLFAFWGSFAQATPETDTAPSVEAELVGWSLGKPPMNAIKLTMSLSNNTPEDRWFLVQKSFYLPDQATSPVTVEALSLHPLANSTGKATVVSITGDSMHFFAVLLPPSATVRIADMPLRAWGELKPDALSFPVVSARALMVNGKPITSLLPRDVHTSAAASGTLAPSAVDWRTPKTGFTHVPLTLTDAQRSFVSVTHRSLDTVRAKGGWE